jgi:subtilisin family serine protease
LAQSTDEQSGSQEPIESLSYTAAYGGRYYVYVRQYDATGNQTLRIHFSDMTPGFHTSGHELNTPADAPYVVTVGAMDYSNYSRKSYSSRGPTEDGRTKPDVMAPSGVSAESYGSRRFGGTSAACPHVAGVAALLKQEFPDYDARLLTTLLISRAHGMGSPRPNNDFGFGLVRMGTPDMNDEPFGLAFLNRGRFAAGQHLRLGVGVLPGYDHPTADVYALVIFPNALGTVDFRALNWVVSPVAGDIFEYRFTGDEPQGRYIYAVIITPPGGDMWDSKTWIDGSSTSFTFYR